MTALSIMRILPSQRAGSPAAPFFFGERSLPPAREGNGKDSREKIAMVYQEPMTALNRLSPSEINWGRCFASPGVKKREALDRAADLLQQVGIPSPTSRINDYPHHLSGV